MFHKYYVIICNAETLSCYLSIPCRTFSWSLWRSYFRLIRQSSRPPEDGQKPENIFEFFYSVVFVKRIPCVLNFFFPWPPISPFLYPHYTRFLCPHKLCQIKKKTSNLNLTKCIHSYSMALTRLQEGGGERRVGVILLKNKIK
jgi:hypothetical protein